MEQPAAGDVAPGPPGSSFQARLWRNLQLGKSRRSAGRSAAGTPGQPAEGAIIPGMISFTGFRRKRQALDRVFSSSQPNLCCSGADSLPASAPCSSPCSTASTPEPGSTLRRLREHLLPHGRAALAKEPPAGAKVGQHASCSAHGAHQLSHQKSSSLPGTDCLEQLLRPAVISTMESSINDKQWNCEGDRIKEKELCKALKINSVGSSNADISIPKLGMYQLDATLKRGTNLAARDRGGTSDPYVKFKIGGKEVFRSKTVNKNLNPVWDEKVCLLVDNLREPLYVKVFDYDFGLQDDFMGSAFLDLTTLELQSEKDVVLNLKDPQHPEHVLGTIHLSVILSPKDNVCADSFQTQSLRLTDRKSHLWRGIVSITLIEGQELKAMDSNGLSDPYVKFRLGHQKYRSKTLPKTLNPQWREQFEMHLFEEHGGVIDITVWDKDAGKRDDFIGRCQVDLSALSKEQTHKLKLNLEEGEGWLILLVTLTASAAISISDLSVSCLQDQKTHEDIQKRYVRTTN